MEIWYLCIQLSIYNATPVCLPRHGPQECLASMSQWLNRARDWGNRSQVHYGWMSICTTSPDPRWVQTGRRD